MNSLSGLVLWPADLPLPYIDNQGEPLHATLASGMPQMRIQRRNRFRSYTTAMMVKWVLNLAQYDSFKAFHKDELFNGMAQFALELKYPYTATLTEWRVRFIGNYAAVYSDGIWSVDASLELIAQVPTEEEIPLDPLEGGYKVIDEYDLENHVQYVDADGNDYYVKMI